MALQAGAEPRVAGHQLFVGDHADRLVDDGIPRSSATRRKQACGWDDQTPLFAQGERPAKAKRSEPLGQP
jgi:hypothetical protein